MGSKAWYQRNKAKVLATTKRARAWRVYGVSLEFLERLSVLQGHCCRICGKAATKNLHGKLYPDHDHQTGWVRGLLCHQCNIGLGVMNDDPVLLERAAAYLRYHHMMRKLGDPK